MRIGTLPSRRRTAALSTSALLALAVVYASCGQEAPSGPRDPSQPAFKGKPPPDDSITVTGFEPDSASQGETFPMTVQGTGFGNGAKLVFVLGGEDVTTISTSTTSVTETELVAEVAIGLEAVVSEDYQVAVSLRGSRGVGTESFKVKVKPLNPANCDDWLVDVTFADRPVLAEAGLMSDGQGPVPPGVNVYSDMEEGVSADIGLYNGNLRLWLREAPQRGINLRLLRSGFDPLVEPVWKISKTWRLDGADVGYDQLMDATNDEGGTRPPPDEDWTPSDVWMTSEYVGDNVSFRAPGSCTLPQPGTLGFENFAVLFNYDGLWSLRYGLDGDCQLPEGELPIPSESEPQKATITYLGDNGGQGPPTWTMELDRALLCRGMQFTKSGKTGAGQSHWLAVAVFDAPATVTVQRLP
ncbi:MAG: hypothetical protein JSV95_03780 [Gemmatimonadota bacterium]|nr:MAG: hypothetical protein JSV95_03780 [Gemmatimonadota bacterium]